MKNKHLFLREPRLEDKEEYQAFLDEWGHEKHVTPYAATLRGDTFETFIQNLKAREEGTYDPKNLVPDKLYILVDEYNHIYGALNLRLSLNDYLLKYGGHIGYGIRPSERKKGYGVKILEYGLEIAAKMGFKKVLITVDEDNKRSERIVLHHNGALENKVFKHDGYILRYWVPTIDLGDLNKYVILICGYLAAYKSTIAKRLSKDLGIVAFVKDEIKETMADVLDDDIPGFNQKLTKTTFELMKLHMVNTLETQKHVILELNIKINEYWDLKRLADKMRIKICMVFMRGNLEELHERYLLRERDRHETHRSFGSLNFDMFTSACESRNELLNMNPIIVNTSGFKDKHYYELKQMIMEMCQL